MSEIPAWSLIVHGGCGRLSPETLPGPEAECRAGLTAALAAGKSVLRDGGSAVDMALDKMPAQPVAGPHRPFQIHGIAGSESAQIGQTQGFLQEIEGRPALPEIWKLPPPRGSPEPSAATGDNLSLGLAAPPLPRFPIRSIWK